MTNELPPTTSEDINNLTSTLLIALEKLPNTVVITPDQLGEVISSMTMTINVCVAFLALGTMAFNYYLIRAQLDDFHAYLESQFEVPSYGK